MNEVFSSRPIILLHVCVAEVSEMPVSKSAHAPCFFPEPMHRIPEDNFGKRVGERVLSRLDVLIAPQGYADVGAGSTFNPQSVVVTHRRSGAKWQILPGTAEAHASSDHPAPRAVMIVIFLTMIISLLLG